MESRAQIVATLGPASKEKEVLRKMVEAHMDVVRLNFAWGSHEEHAQFIKNIRELSKETGEVLPIIQDLPGPRVQTKEGHKFNEGAQNPLTQEDLKHLDFGIKHNVDYVTLSYVGGAKDLENLRDEIKKRRGTAKVIAKVERKEALDNLDEIINAADAIMIGRGDLGQSIPIEQIPAAQKDIIQRAKKAGKPVITATEMLLSMVENPTPTRAEVTDVNQAIMEGSDAVMLSEETARGKYPIEAVVIMEKIILEAEKSKYRENLNKL